MKLLCLGTGSAFTLAADNYQSNFLLISPSGKHLLIDCGTDIRYSLKDQGYKFSDIDAVYISHLHSDHVGGLEWLGFISKFQFKPIKPKLFTSPDIANPLWDSVLSGGMGCLEEIKADLNTYFAVQPMVSKEQFEWEGYTFNLIKTLHVQDDGIYKPSYGLEFKVNGKSIWITTDLKLTPDLHADLYDNASLIFHDCEISSSPSHVHPAYDDLTLLAPEVKSKIWLYHYDSPKLPDVEKDGFLGLAIKGQLFDLKSILDKPD